jgi:hypothetical protein
MGMYFPNLYMVILVFLAALLGIYNI